MDAARNLVPNSINGVGAVVEPKLHPSIRAVFYSSRIAACVDKLKNVCIKLYESSRLRIRLALEDTTVEHQR